MHMEFQIIHEDHVLNNEEWTKVNEYKFFEKFKLRKSFLKILFKELQQLFNIMQSFFDYICSSPDL